MGTFTIELHEKEAPETVRNFLAYVDEGFYAGTIFHRVIEDFMIQGGGLDREMSRKKTRDPIANEAMNKLKNRAGTVAMARTSAPNSATSQFFVNVVDNPMLDYRDTSAEGIGYCVFGKVVSGMDVVAKIKAGQPLTSRIEALDAPHENSGYLLPPPGTIDQGSVATAQRANAVREIKDWQAIMDYLRALPATRKGGLPVIGVAARSSEVRAIRIG